MAPIVPTLRHERRLWNEGLVRVAGVDEVGVAPTCGAVVAAAVIMRPGCHRIPGVRDSKTLSAGQRERLAPIIRSRAVAVGVGAASVREIDQLNIYHATHLAMRRAIARVGGHEHVLVDGNRIAGFEAQVGPYTNIVDGDARVYSIACASVVAKVVRDRMMELLAARYPGLVCVAPMVTPQLRELFAAHCTAAAPRAAVRMLDGHARQALAAADVVLVASGTATLEAALCKRPMVVAYKLGAITAFLLRTLGLVKVRYFSQPNLLADAELVPEFFQERANAGNLADALGNWLEHPEQVARVEREFASIHASLRRDGAELAAREIAELLAAWTARAGAAAT